MEDKNWKARALLLGGALGMLTGLGVAYLLVSRAEKSGRPIGLTPGEGVRLGLLLMGLLRQVAELGPRSK